MDCASYCAHIVVVQYSWALSCRWSCMTTIIDTTTNAYHLHCHHHHHRCLTRPGGVVGPPSRGPEETQRNRTAETIGNAIGISTGDEMRHLHEHALLRIRAGFPKNNVPRRTDAFALAFSATPSVSSPTYACHCDLLISH